MAVSVLQRLSAHSRAPIFMAAGADARDRVDDLSLEPGLRFVDTPRHANVLMIAGTIRSCDVDALHRVHDQLPHPRATLRWAEAPVPGFEACAQVRPQQNPTEALHELYRRLLTGGIASEPDLRPDRPPAPWQGLGEHGQGGKGMMGGTPYGRPMAMTTDDLRDGLALDAYTLRVGPFAPMLPRGLVLSLTLQGDVIQQVEAEVPPSPDTPGEQPLASYASLDDLISLERARAAHHLRCLARVLRLLQLDALAARHRRFAFEIEHGDRAHVDALRWAMVMPAIPPGLGALDTHAAASLDGAALRASGGDSDWRTHHRLYRELDFSVICQREGDVRARVRQWLAEVRQSLALVARAHARKVTADAAQGEQTLDCAAPRSTSASLRDLLVGLEWNEAVLVINSFDAQALATLAAADALRHDEHAGEQPPT